MRCGYSKWGGKIAQGSQALAFLLDSLIETASRWVLVFLELGSPAAGGRQGAGRAQVGRWVQAAVPARVCHPIASWGGAGEGAQPGILMVGE